MARALSTISLSAILALGCGSSGQPDQEAQGSTGVTMNAGDATGSGGMPASNASSSATVGATGGSDVSGQGGAGGTPAPFVPGMHVAPPQVTNLGGPVLTTPKVMAITWDSDPNQADVDKFMTEISASQYWSATTSEYGVGKLTALPPLHKNGGGGSLNDQDLREALAANLGKNGAWGPADPETIYFFVIPKNVEFDGCCTSYGGYHDEAVLGKGVAVPYAMACTCGAKTKHGVALTEMQLLGIVMSHELVEAATDPFPEGKPAFVRTDTNNGAWTLITEGEVGDMCEFDPSAEIVPSDMSYMVQRTWSNAAALAGTAPCVPPLPAPSVYLNSVPVVTDNVAVPYQGGAWVTKGVKIPVGQSKTIDLQLFSDGPTSGAWSITAYDYGAFRGTSAPHLQFALDQSTGENGDTRKLTITVLSKGGALGVEPFLIESDLGDQRNLWMGVVGN